MIENNQRKSNVRGGARKGAGRKPGAANQKTREVADKAAAEGVTPLEVMIEAMRDAYAKNGAVGAFPFAKDAAPYMHPRISAVELTGKDGGPITTKAERDLTDEELAVELAKYGIKP